VAASFSSSSLVVVLGPTFEYEDEDRFAEDEDELMCPLLLRQGP
jgi:hypothetical protein